MQNLKLLCIGDIHFGATLGVFCENSKESFQEQALLNAGNYAINNNIDAVLFSGDILNDSSSYFEAIAALKKFLDISSQKNIKAYAVSGNHDFDVLKKICEKEQNIEILGGDGSWEEKIVCTANQKKFLLKGISFTNQHKTTSHFLNYKRSAYNNMPSIGLVHADVGVTQSDYSPASLDDFLNTSEDIWVCGHIHASKYINSGKKVLIPGSLQGLDPTETGLHGGYLIEFNDENITNVSLIPFAKGYYENASIFIENVKDFESSITKLLNDTISKYKSLVPFEHNISIRLTINAPFKNLSDFQKKLDELEDENLIIYNNATVEKIILKSDYLNSLQSFTNRKDPLGILANYLMVLKTKEPIDKYNEYIQNTSKEILEKVNQNSFSFLNSSQETQENIRECMLQSGEILISKFLKELGLTQ